MGLYFYYKRARQKIEEEFNCLRENTKKHKTFSVAITK